MGSEWETVEFGNLLIEPLRNGIYKPKQFHGTGIKIINMGELFAYPRLGNVSMKRITLDERERIAFDIQSGDLLFARRSLVAEGAGKCIIVMDVQESTTFESSIIRARLDKTKAHPLFYYYLFNSPLGHYLLDTIRRQVAVSGITGSDLKRLNVPQPPLPEQRAIAHVLGTLDDKIELNRRTNETLEAMARALFKSWFVDFEPVRAKAEGRETGLPPEIDGLFPDSFEESELGEVPKGWRVKPLDQIAHFLNGLALQNFPHVENEKSLPVIKIAQLHAGNTQGSDSASPKIPSNYIVKDGDVLFSWSGSLSVVIWHGGDGALNQHLFKVTSVDYPKWFYYYWTKQHLLNFQAIAAGKATTMGHIQRHHLSDAKVVIPPKEVLNKMSSYFTPLLVGHLINQIQSRSLASIRDALLPKLLSGEMRILDAEKFAGGAA